MDRTKYNQCMSPYIKGHKSKEQRVLDFCVGAKMCTGKAKSRDEAVAICKLPKPPKPMGTGKKHRAKTIPCEQEAAELAGCMGNIISYPLPANRQELAQNIFNSIMECRCGIKNA